MGNKLIRLIAAFGKYIGRLFSRENDISIKFQAPAAITYTILSTATTAAALDLGTNYTVIGIQCADCSNIQAATSMTAKVAFDAGSVVHDLYEQDAPATQWSQGSLPATGTLAFILTHTFGVRKISLILSKAASGGDVVFKIYGFRG